MTVDEGEQMVTAMSVSARSARSESQCVVFKVGACYLTPIIYICVYMSVVTASGNI